MNNYYRFPFLRPHPVTSPYGPRGGSFHYGCDFGWNNDDEGQRFPVVASADGVVVYYADEGPGGGRTMTLRHEGGESSRYYHLTENLVSIGDAVLAGQIIAISGSSGGVAPHLHFEIHDGNGKPVDPVPLLEWPTTPTPPPAPPPIVLPKGSTMSVMLCDGFSPVVIDAENKIAYECSGSGSMPAFTVTPDQRTNILQHYTH